MTAVRVLLVDDHALVRSGLRALLEAIDGIEVVGEAANGRDGLRLMAERAPDVVLMDITMPDMNGLTAVERAARDHPGIAVLMVSMHADREFVEQAMRFGARGYLPKNAGRHEFETAVRAVAGGRTYVSPAVAARDGVPRAALEALSTRHREVLQLVAEGLTTKEIATRLGVSVKTADTHRTELMRRLGVHDVASLVRRAIRLGVVGVES